jgi:hypothetical protein
MVSYTLRFGWNIANKLELDTNQSIKHHKDSINLNATKNVLG